MINHSNCDHPSTSSARAKCRRQLAAGGEGKAPRKKMGATPREPGGKDDNYGQTPREKWMECDKCGVERIAYKGTDPVSKVLIYVGEKCYWYIKDAPDRSPLDY